MVTHCTRTWSAHGRGAADAGSAVDRLGGWLRLRWAVVAGIQVHDAVPEVLDQTVHGNHLAPRDEQQREHAALARAAEVGNLEAAVRLERRV